MGVEQKETVSLERYSFSKLSTWWTCPFGYYQRYVEHKEGIGNAFSSYGTFVHSLFEQYAKGELELGVIPDVYEWQFDGAVTEKFPYNKFVDLRESYYRQGLSFFKQFSGYDKFKILGVEEEFSYEVDNWKFVGIIDLVFEDEYGRLIIRDYKSKASFKNEEEQHKYARQLYLYARYVKEKYGRYPDELQFLMFRKNTNPVVIDFNEEDADEALEWAKQTVSLIREAFNYPPQCDEFYGQNLCNHREYCPHKIKPKRRGKQKKR